MRAADFIQGSTPLRQRIKDGTVQPPMPIDATTDTQVFTIERRPTLSNAVARDPKSLIGQRKAWRNAVLRAIEQGELRPATTPITISTSVLYPTAETPPDTDAAAFAVKLVIDGLVANGIIPDDHPDYIAAVIQVRPQPNVRPGIMIQLAHTP